MPIEIRLRGKVFEEGFRADLVVNACVLVEIKSVQQLAPLHKEQVLTYLKLTGIPVGLLINFGDDLLKDNIKRIVLPGAPDLKA